MRSPTPCAFLLPALLLSLALPVAATVHAAPADPPVLAWEAVVDGSPVPGGGAYDVMQDLVTLPDGGVVAAGYSTPPDAYGEGAPPQTALVVRLDATGREVWRRHLGDGRNFYETRRIRRTADGGFLVACSAFTPWTDAGSGIYYNTSFLSRLDGSGTELWRHAFDPLQLELVGDFDLLPDGSAVAAGRVWFDQGSTAVAVAKLSPAGSLLWLRRVAPEYIDGVARVAAGPDGGFYVCSGAAVSLTVTRHGPDGTPAWSTVIQGLDGSSYGYDKHVDSLVAVPGGGAVATGAAREYNPPAYGPFRPFTVAFDGSGRQASTLVVPATAAWNHAVERLPDGTILSAESPESSNGGVELVRYDGAGREMWRVPFGTRGAETYAGALRGTGDGGIAAAGSVPEGGEYWLPFDGYVVRYDGGAETVPTGTAVRIDVLPGNPENPVNPRSRGLLPVALLSSDSFDASRVNTASVTLEGAPVARSGRRLHAVRKDVDGDGRCDLLLHFSVPALALSPAATEVTLRGTAPGGSPFSAVDGVRIVGVPPAKAPPPKGFGPATRKVADTLKKVLCR